MVNPFTVSYLLLESWMNEIQFDNPPEKRFFLVINFPIEYRMRSIPFYGDQRSGIMYRI